MKLYGGIDLHSNNSVIALLDEEDNLVYRRRLPNDLQQVVGALEPFGEAIRRAGGRVDLQLVLAGRWADGGRLPRRCAHGMARRQTICLIRTPCRERRAQRAPNPPRPSG